MTALTDALAQYEADFAEFQRILAQYPASLRMQSGACGEWAPQQVVAHISGWLVEAKRRYARFHTGTGQIDYNIDAFNAVSVRIRKDYNWSHTVAELEKLGFELASLAKQVPAERAERDERYKKWLDIMAEEFRDHGAQLKAFQEQQA
ncbi:MAG: hypothetical protein KC546_20660 [Anaerolineae bacterium]|nr:hypothetical protein [Anaerolineae bacterium]